MSKKKASVKKGEYEWSAEIKRIIPLRNNHCYIQDDKGKLHHLERDSVQAIVLMKYLNNIMNGKITRELAKLGWDDILELVQDESE